MSFVGVNIGALTVKTAALRGESVAARVAAHQGRPLEILDEILCGAEFADARYFAVSGQRGHVSEVAAIQRALRQAGGDFDAVASLGGESFLLYVVDQGRIAGVLSHNKCAAGSGEFFMQQIGRMGLDADEAIRRSFQGKVVPLASRCSVHCKSDITHKLNRGEATVEDVLRTLHDSMANKVIALMDKAQRELSRVLLIGGVTRNAAMLAALREKLPSTALVVLPESAWFEAWGTALIARDDPIHRFPRISPQKALDHMEPLGAAAERVRVIASPARRPPSDAPLALGLDAGSTTTKAVLVDPSTRLVVASHYTRTRGDPVTAARECLRALAEQAGNRRIGLVATTGSAREITGAWLGTEDVHNEISAQAAGAAHFDADVDTIFEIGGQDSKYVRLRNGVPIDYAMNNACSAGTGSFLEESALSDLGLTVSEIGDMALKAASPARFQATCAAFINSDIRTAQQQGHSREEIVAGLVYAIAGNYLHRVKGPRPVGRRILLQGGVALNRAVGHAFAALLDREVVIPPEPELIGALGVALLGLQRRGGELEGGTDLLALAAPGLRAAGRFTCRACSLACTIERFEVAGRRFPFGGRCSLYERVWKRAARARTAPDLVERRARLIFSAGGASGEAAANGLRVGIPRALTAHALYPLYATFFSSLGIAAVLSDIDPRGDLKPNSGFCFPAQIAHGAVLDLVKKGVHRVFLPHVVRLPRDGPCKDSYLCPVTQAGPYFLAKAFPGLKALSPVLDFTEGYAPCTAMVDMAVLDMGFARDAAARAWDRAAAAQIGTERALAEMGRQALDQALAAGEPAILLAGHSYNAFTPEASQSVGRKLASMGVTAIPADCLPHEVFGPTAWHFSNGILNAAALASRHPNLFLLCVSNFSCTIDAFTQAKLAAQLGSKPSLILEIDAHTADAGVQTRLEAFLDIIRHHRGGRPASGRDFVACRLGPGGLLVRPDGERVPLTDPRVRLYFPNFSPFHAEALALASRWLGLHPGEMMPLERSQMEAGLKHTSARECLPLPICIGQILRIHANRRPGEIAGYYMVRGGAPCVVDAYQDYVERFIADQRLEDFFLLSPGEDNDYLGLDRAVLARHLTPAILTADLLVEIEHVLRVVGAPGSLERFHDAWSRFAGASRSLERFQEGLPAFVESLAAIPRSKEPGSCPRVVLTGDFFTRFSPFFMDGVRDMYADRGVILQPADLSELFLYGLYDGVAETAGRWGMKPGGLALARACMKVFQREGKQYLQQWLAYCAERASEQRHRRAFRGSGLLVADSSDVSSIFDRAAEHVSPVIFGEAIPTVGKGLGAEVEGYDGVIVIGPFNCLPYRISESILKPLCIRGGMPLLTYESDGYPVSPSFLRQVEVHIQQVIAHAASRRREPTSPPR